jgi:hypothetical protein
MSLANQHELLSVSHHLDMDTCLAGNYISRSSDPFVGALPAPAALKLIFRDYTDREDSGLHWPTSYK